MNEAEQRDLARRLADVSEVFDFEGALAFVQFDLKRAEKLLRMREEGKKWHEEFARSRERVRLSASELR